MPLALDAVAARLPEIVPAAKHAFVLIDVIGAPADDAASAARSLESRAPLCFALVIDASSSMRGPRFAIAQQTARRLVDSLGPQDRAAVITFDRDARIALDATLLDDEGRANARRSIDRMITGHGTNLAAGWREAADALSRLILPGSARRILLLTDGKPSVGERDVGVLAAMVAQGRSRGIETSVVAIGEATDDELCTQLARAGDGRFYYLRTEGLLGDVVAHEAEGARRLAAVDVSLVIAFSPRVARGEVMHRYACQADGRTLEVRMGAVSYTAPRSVLLQIEIADPDSDAMLGAAMARGRAIVPRKIEPTLEGYALGARGADERPMGEAEATSDRLTLSCRAGAGDKDARRRIGTEVLILRTLTEVRSAWDGYDQRDSEAISRRIGRARELRRVLEAADLVDVTALVALPDLDAIEAAMSDRGANAREARRTFSSWAHNTHNSQLFPIPRKPDGKE